MGELIQYALKGFRDKPLKTISKETIKHQRNVDKFERFLTERNINDPYIDCTIAGGQTNRKLSPVKETREHVLT